MQKHFFSEGVEKTNYPKYNFSYLTGNSPSTIFLVGEFSCHRAVTVDKLLLCQKKKAPEIAKTSPSDASMGDGLNLTHNDEIR